MNNKYPELKAEDRVMWNEEYNDTEIGWEERDGVNPNLNPENVFEVEEANSGGVDIIDYSNPEEWDVRVTGCYYHPGHFIRIKTTNEDRIRERLAEVRQNKEKT